MQSTAQRVLLVLLCVSESASKLPYDPHTDHLHDACWVPDYCEPEKFEYKLCKLRLRNRKTAARDEYTCPEGEYCEELECAHKCWLPTNCWCNSTGPHEGRMMCEDEACFKHPSTQWGLCRPEPTKEELAGHVEQHGTDDDPDAEDGPPLPTGFHFWTPDELLHNAKLHIDEDHMYARPRIPKPWRPTPKEEL